MALDPVNRKEKLSQMMKNLWLERKIKPKNPWNKGISTKTLGKSRPKKEWIVYLCQNCGKGFEDWRILKRKFCSRKCKVEFQRKNPELYAHLLKPEIGQKISEAKKGIPLLKFKGAGHPNWQGGKSFEPYGIEFNKELKEEIKKRDSYTCQLCNAKERLRIHHIDYCKTNNTKDNLITLCIKCNTIVNKDRIDWMHFFKEKLSKI